MNLFQARLHRPVQMNGGAYHGPNTGLHPPVLHRPSAEGYNPPNAAPASNQSIVSPFVSASRVTNPQDTQQQPEALGPVKLTCKQCQKQFSSKPEVLQFKVEISRRVTRLSFSFFVFSFFVCLVFMINV